MTNSNSVVHTIYCAGVRLQAVEQVLVASRGGSLDRRDNLCRERWVTVAQLGQLHRKGSQPATQHFTPSEREGQEHSQRAFAYKDSNC